MILTMTETEEILRTIPIFVEGKSLTEWVALSSDEMKETESYKYALNFFQRKDERVIADMEAIINDPSKKHGDPENPRYDTKLWAKQRIAQIAEQTPEEQSTDSLAGIIANLHDPLEECGGVVSSGAFDDNNFNMKPKGGTLALGYAALERAGWKKCEIDYSGGHDSGGIDLITITKNNGEVLEVAWQDFEEALKPASLPRLAPSSGWPAPKIPHEIEDEAIQIPMFYIAVEGESYHPCHIRIVTENALTLPVEQTFGSWAGNFDAQGTLVWDLDNKEEELYLEYEITEYVSKQEIIL